MHYFFRDPPNVDSLINRVLPQGKSHLQLHALTWSSLYYLLTLEFLYLS